MRLLKLTVALTFGLAVMQSQANEFCDAQAGLAGSIMTARQKLTPRDEVESVVHSPQGRALVNLAWTMKVGRTVAEKSKAIESYKTHVYQTCISVTENQKPLEGIRM